MLHFLDKKSPHGSQNKHKFIDFSIFSCHGFQDIFMTRHRNALIFGSCESWDALLSRTVIVSSRLESTHVV